MLKSIQSCSNYLLMPMKDNKTMKVAGKSARNNDNLLPTTSTMAIGDYWLTGLIFGSRSSQPFMKN